MGISVTLEGDKSLSHRYLIFQFLCSSQVTVDNLSTCEDVKTTANCLENIQNGHHQLNCGNSGTTLRLLTGLLTGIEGSWHLTGDSSLTKRPMDRVISPLVQFGAKIESKTKTLPITVRQSNLRQIEYFLNIPSAQVKSALILAGLVHKTPVTLTGKLESRDHTEVFLANNGFNIISEKGRIEFSPNQEVQPFEVNVPGDPSSACFLIIKRLLNPGPEMIIKNLLLNPTRTYYLEVLKKMGANLSVKKKGKNYGEEVGDISVSYTPLEQMKNIPSIDHLPLFIDEVPALSLLMIQVQGSTHIKNATELKFKESNRISELSKLYESMGVFNSIIFDDKNLVISGGKKISSPTYLSKDHRIAMTAALIDNSLDKVALKKYAQISFPKFFEHLNSI